MRRARLSVALAICGLPIVLMDAMAQGRPPLPPSELRVVALAYAQGVADLKAALEACSPKQVEEWDTGREMLLSSLAKASLSGGDIEQIAAALDAAPSKPFNCKSEEANYYAGLDRVWPAYFRIMLEAAGVPVVEPAAPDPRLAAVIARTRQEIPLLREMTVCLSLFEPAGFALLYGDLNQLSGQVATELTAAGQSAQAAASIAEMVTAQRIYQPPTDRDAARAACVASKDWQSRYATMSWYALPGVLREIAQAQKN